MHLEWKRGLTLGFLSWLVPFICGFLAFPLKKVSPPLFDTVMSLVLIATPAWLAGRYFRGRQRVPAIPEALLLGFLWLAMNLVLDYPMFSQGPMKMPMSKYWAEIGTGYLLFPAFLGGCAWVGRASL